MASILSLAVNSAFMMQGKSDTQEEAYVITVSDPSKSIFQGIRIANKASVNFNTEAASGPGTEVTIIETNELTTTDVGTKLL
ncbi:hypothetical protein HYV49_03100, partial [Candidatus Pacearchaeota archaeon]|nr:hypothetical protein [Candidatus Pacearchaeota archaeon]